MVMDMINETKDSEYMDVTSSENNEMTILSCMSDVVENAAIPGDLRSMTFNPKVYEICKEQISYVEEMVGITQKQVVLLSFIMEKSGRYNLDKHDLASAMGMSFIKLLSYDKQLKGLAEKKLIYINNSNLNLRRKVIDIFSKNEKYIIPEAKGLSTVAILEEMNEIIGTRVSGKMDFDSMMKELDALFKNNSGSGLVKAAKDVGFDCEKMEVPDRIVFYFLVKRYIYNDDDRVDWSDFDDILEYEFEVGQYRSRFSCEEFELQKRHIIEPCNENGMVNPDAFHITDSVKAEIFAEVGGVRNRSRSSSLKITQASEIVYKELFYNSTEDEQIGRLSNLLEQKNYKSTCERLKSSGMRTGFTCIFYGGPGTGKTESVYQLAKATGRGIVTVNVSEIKSCWVGESEKLIKGVFDKYNALVKEADVVPILFFNEADAIFGIRREGASTAVDKMENSIQNIILQEMEKLEGILIATTNLTQNLDKAFERRFLYKIRFNKPGLEPRTKIWQSMIPDLTFGQARELAERFDFSGGQIENITRKKMIKSIIDGTEPDFAEVKGYCSEELIQGNGSDNRKIGFRQNF